MCLSPDMMTTQAIEEYITDIEERLSWNLSDGARQIWTGRLDGFRQILKERAEAGTYHH